MTLCVLLELSCKNAGLFNSTLLLTLNIDLTEMKLVIGLAGSESLGSSFHVLLLLLLFELHRGQRADLSLALML